ncbi:MAG: VWA domain-containing protein, partial [Candidatus Omnitrophica bacterium]|nr:VWA domain-containing protein [Candidatus Omnitrophota bacterium]
MHLLSPLGLLGLLSLPVLLWLWRLSAARRPVHVPSLIPFEHLLRRQPRRRTRLVVNGLFWLQLAALAGLALALAQPVVFQRQANTSLIVLDTSASMGARWKGSTAFEHARRALLERIERKGLTDQ